MKKYMIVLSLIFIIVFPTSFRVYAQDSAEVVILSPKIGEAIDTSEREYYHIFPAVKNFISAVIVKLPNGKYEARFTTGSSTAQKLIFVEMPEALIYSLAEKIDHYEEIEKGTYTFGTSPPLIQVGTKIVKWEPDTLKSTISYYKPDPDLLPLAQVAPPFRISSYPYVGFGYSLTFSTNILEDFEKSFDAIETKYRSQGYSIPSHSKLNGGEIHWLTCNLRISSHIELLCAFGKSTADGITLAQGDVLYRYTVPKSEQIVDLFIGAGVASFELEVKRSYKARISPISSYGEFTYLDDITVDAQCRGFHLIGGVEFNFEFIGIALYGSYFRFPDISTTVNQGESVTANASGLLAGLRIVAYF